jgi:hypothetical protein
VILPSRALGTKSGDQQARAELLGKLLAAAGDTPYMLCHGTGRSAYYLVMAQVAPEEAKELAAKTGAPPTVIRMGKLDLVPMQLEAGSALGSVSGKLYDAASAKWTGAVTLTPFK